MRNWSADDPEANAEDYFGDEERLTSLKRFDDFSLMDCDDDDWEGGYEV